MSDKSGKSKDSKNESLTKEDEDFKRNAPNE